MNDYLITIRIKAADDRRAWQAWSLMRELLEASDQEWGWASVTSPTPMLPDPVRLNRTNPAEAAPSSAAPSGRSRLHHREPPTAV